MSAPSPSHSPQSTFHHAILPFRGLVLVVLWGMLTMVSGIGPSVVLRDFEGREKGVVFDGLVSNSVIEATQNYLGAFGNWEHKHVIEETVNHVDEVMHPEEAIEESGVRFRQRLALSWVRQSPVGEAFQKAVALGSGDGVWDIVEAEAHHLRRGDITFVHRACHDIGKSGVDDGDWYGMLVMVGVKDVDEYAELVLFDKTQVGQSPSILDSYGGVRLKRGRIVALPCSTLIRRSAPSVGTGLGHLGIVARLRKRPDPSTPLPLPREEFDEDEDHEEEEIVGEEGGVAPRFWGSDFPIEIRTTEQRLRDWGLEWAVGDDVAELRRRTLAKRTRMYASTLGRTVHVFDGLFPDPTPLRLLREHVRRNATYNFDDSSDKDSDNVQWIVGLDEKEFTQTVVSRVVSAVVNSVTPWRGFFPYDVSVNIIRSWDNTKMHTDCGDGELEYTALLYLNEDVGVHSGAETVFFDDVGPSELARRKKKKEEYGGSVGGGMGYGKGPPDAEVVAVVRPVFGRMAVFNGNIPHSARPPAPVHRGIRFTFAIKHSSSAVAAKAKTLHQALHTVQDEVERDVDDKGTESAWVTRKKQLNRFEEQVAKIKRQSTANDIPTLESIANLLSADVIPQVTSGFTFQGVPPGSSVSPRMEGNTSTVSPSPPAAAIDPRAEPALEKAKGRIEQWVLELETETLRSLYQSMQISPETMNSLLERRKADVERTKSEKNSP